MRGAHKCPLRLHHPTFMSVHNIMGRNEFRPAADIQLLRTVGDHTAWVFEGVDPQTAPGCVICEYRSTIRRAHDEVGVSGPPGVLSRRLVPHVQ